MDIKSQFKKLKENWLIALVILLLIFIAGSVDFSVPSSLDSSFFDLDGIIAEDKYISTIAPGLSRGSEGFDPDIDERILTRSAYLDTEIHRGKFQEVSKKLKGIIETTDSFLLNENVIKHDSRFRQYYSGTYSIRIETKKYDLVINQLKELGEVQEFSENVNDITDGYTKLGIELAAEKERLVRYRALYKEANNVEDKLSLSDRIYNQERTIKYYEDRLTNLDEKVEYSSATIQLNEKHSDYAGIKFINFGTLVNNIVRGINNLLTVIFFLLPYGLLAWLIYYGFGWWNKRRKK